MAIDPATAKLIAKLALDKIKDEETREKITIGIIISIILILLIILLPVFLITETLDNIKSAFGFGTEEEIVNSEYSQVLKIKQEYGIGFEGELVFLRRFAITSKRPYYNL